MKINYINQTSTKRTSLTLSPTELETCNLWLRLEFPKHSDKDHFDTIKNVIEYLSVNKTPSRIKPNLIYFALHKIEQYTKTTCVNCDSKNQTSLDLG